MAIVASGNPITFGETGSDDIRSELGEESPGLGLAEYYGATVDLPSIGAALSFSDFYGVEELKIAVVYGQTDPTQELEAEVAEIPEINEEIQFTVQNATANYGFTQIGYEEDTLNFWPVYSDGTVQYIAQGFDSTSLLATKGFPTPSGDEFYTTTVDVTTRNYKIWGYNPTGEYFRGGVDNNAPLNAGPHYPLRRTFPNSDGNRWNFKRFSTFAVTPVHGTEYATAGNEEHFYNIYLINGTVINNGTEFIFEKYSNDTDDLYLYVPTNEDYSTYGNDINEQFFLQKASVYVYADLNTNLNLFTGWAAGLHQYTTNYVFQGTSEGPGSLNAFQSTYTYVHRAVHYSYVNFLHNIINTKKQESHNYKIYRYTPVLLSNVLPAVSATPAYTYDNARKSKYRKNDYDNLDTYATTAAWPLSQSYSADWKPTGSAAISQYFMEKMQINNGLYQVRSRETFDTGNVSGVDLTTLPGRNTPVQLNFTIATGKAAEFGYTQFFRLYRANAANANTLIDYFVCPQNPADKPTIASSSVAANETTVDFTLGNLDATQTYRLRWQSYQDCVVDVTNVDAVASGFSEEFLGNAIPATIRLSGGDSTDYSDLKQGVDLMLEVKVSTSPLTWATVRCHEFFRKGTTKIADTTCDFLDGFSSTESTL
tara:strand:+ start:2140 stop:4095 length:1956 start_codon:yes stop_codon:yes gene_type:complete